MRAFADAGNLRVIALQLPGPRCEPHDQENEQGSSGQRRHGAKLFGVLFVTIEFMSLGGMPPQQE